MKKQLISVTLVLAFLLSLSMNAFASNTTTSEQQQIRSVAEKVQPTDYDIYEDFELLVSEFVEQGSSTDIGISGVANSLSDIAVVNKTNIVISDEYGNTLGEFHADGYTAEFVYEENIPHDSHTGKLTSEKQLKYIKDSEGLVQQFLLDGENIVNIRSIINGEVIQERQVNSALAINTGDVIEPSSTSSASTFYVYHSDGTRTDMSTLIDDIDFEFCTSCASVAEIQQFFEDKNSPLQYTIDNYIYDGESVYRAGTCDPAQYIHDICIRSLLSPKLILATLQKESSLVSSLHLNTPHSSRTFYFCMGNGSDSSASSTGFEHQIMGAQRKDNIVLDLQVLRVSQVLNMEELLHLFDTVFCKVDRFFLLIYNEISGLLDVLAHDGVHLGELAARLASLKLAGQDVTSLVELR